MVGTAEHASLACVVPALACFPDQTGLVIWPFHPLSPPQPLHVQGAVAEAAGVAPVLLGQVQAALLAALQNDTASISGERLRMASSYVTEGWGLPGTGGCLHCTTTHPPSQAAGWVVNVDCVRVALGLGLWPARCERACGRLPASA